MDDQGILGQALGRRGEPAIVTAPDDDQMEIAPAARKPRDEESDHDRATREGLERQAHAKWLEQHDRIRSTKI